jgi:hypothetical protein
MTEVIPGTPLALELIAKMTVKFEEFRQGMDYGI